MQIILSLSAALVAVAFFILVIYLVKTLKSLQAILTGVSKTLKEVEKHLEDVTTETTLLLQKTNVLADDFQHKAKSLNSVVDAVKDVGSTVSKFNGTLNNLSTSFDRQVEENKEKVSQIIQWSDVLLELKDKWRARKHSKNENTPNERKRVRSN